MLHALHGNAGLPEDLHPLLQAAGREFHAWHLWQWLRENPDNASFDGFAAELNAMDGAKPRILLGYSLGGRLALYALTQHPEAWDAAILLSVHPGLTNDAERAVRLAQDQAWGARFLHEPWDGVMQAWNAQPVLARGPNANQRAVEPWRREVAAGFDMWSLARQPDLRARLPLVKCPVLWITGERDAKFTGLAAEAAALMAHGRHRVIAGAGHRVHVDWTAEVAEAMREFLTIV